MTSQNNTFFPSFRSPGNDAEMKSATSPRSGLCHSREIRWVSNSEAFLFTCCPAASRCASRRGRNVAICLTVKLLNATAAFIAAQQFFRRHASFAPHRAHAPPDETTRRCARPARGIPRMRCARFMVLRCSGRRREPRSRIAWNLVSRSAISLRNARRHTYVSYVYLRNVILGRITAIRAAKVRQSGR